MITDPDYADSQNCIAQAEQAERLAKRWYLRAARAQVRMLAKWGITNIVYTTTAASLFDRAGEHEKARELRAELGNQAGQQRSGRR